MSGEPLPDPTPSPERADRLRESLAGQGVGLSQLLIGHDALAGGINTDLPAVVLTTMPLGDGSEVVGPGFDRVQVNVAMGDQDPAVDFLVRGPLETKSPSSDAAAIRSASVPK
jgi:hypothetical protein